MTSDRTPTPDDGLDPRWVDAMRSHADAPADDATWQAIVDRAGDDAVVTATGPSPHRSSARRWWGAVAAAAVVALVGAGLVVATSGSGDDDGETVQVEQPEGVGPPAAEWERLPDPPLSPRDGVMSAWTGEELLVFGGTTWTCPPNADCRGPEPDELLTDGAALDPGTGEWRPIAPIPASDLGGTVATVGDDVYVLQHRAYSGLDGGEDERRLVRYSVPDDEWTEVDLPEQAVSGWYTVQAAGDRLVLVPGSDEAGIHPLLTLEPSTGTWAELPAAPLPLMFDRSAVWSAPYLYVFGKELVPNPGSEEPSLTIGARFEVTTRKWAPLPDSEILGNPAAASDGLLVSAQPGGADGGEVNSWGRTYPYGGIFDTATQTWRDLPEAPGGDDAGMAAGVIGSTSASFDGSGGDLFDTTTEAWTSMPALDEAPGATSRESWAGEVHTAGLDAVVVGGVDWSDDQPELLGDAWIWRSGRTSGTATDPDPTTTSTPTSTPTTAAVTTETTGPTPPEQRYLARGAVLDDGSTVRLCARVVTDVEPIECWGPTVAGWDWDRVEGETSAAGSTWGDYDVIGTYDGTTFTLTEDARPVDPADDPSLERNGLPDADSCVEAEPAWTSPAPDSDVVRATESGMADVPGYLGHVFFYDSPTGRPGPKGEVLGILRVTLTEAGDGAMAGIRALWGGPVCTVEAAHTADDLTRARDEVPDLVAEHGAMLLTHGVDGTAFSVRVEVLLPDPSLQTSLDERFGPGVAYVVSYLQPLA